MHDAMHEAYNNRALGDWNLSPEEAYRVAKAQQRRIRRENHTIGWALISAVCTAVVIGGIIVGLLPGWLGY